MDRVTLNLTLAISMVLVLVAGALTEGPRNEDMAVAQDLSDAEKQAARDLRKEMAAAAMCREQHGESLVRWTEAGTPVCIPRRKK